VLGAPGLTVVGSSAMFTVFTYIAPTLREATHASLADRASRADHELHLSCTAIVSEVIGTTVMKQSEGLTRSCIASSTLRQRGPAAACDAVCLVSI
jgi:hypothetical protein